VRNTPSVAALAIENPTVAARPVLAHSTPRFWRAVTGDAGGRVAVVVLALLILLALLAPWIAPYDPAAQLGIVDVKFQSPSRQHWLGTDSVSRDVLSRMLFGAQVSLRVAVLAAGMSALLGLVWGAAAGYAGGVLDTVLMRTVDTLLAIPRVLLLLTIIALWGQVTPAGLILMIGATGWFGVSRLARAEALTVRTRDFVSAARALGTRHRTILVRHVLPHALGPVLVAATVAVGQVIVLEAALSYFGYGIPEPAASWGRIIYDGRDQILHAWWLTVFPGAALIITSLAVNAVADRLRTALNPRQLHGR
jgi:peptide/nickel transport system permease protein